MNPQVRSPGHQLQRCIASDFAKLQKYILLFCTDCRLIANTNVITAQLSTCQRAGKRSHIKHIQRYHLSQSNRGNAIKTLHSALWRIVLHKTIPAHKRCFECHQQTLQMRCIIGSITIGAHGADPLISRLRGRVDFSEMILHIHPSGSHTL